MTTPTTVQCPSCYGHVAVPSPGAPALLPVPTSPTTYGDILSLSIVNFTHGPRDIFFCSSCTHKFIVMLRSFSMSPPVTPPPPPPAGYVARPTPGPTLRSAP